ncbi:phage tail tube protein [Collinsella sp. Sow4_E3]|uniref:phage tail tube protein n=1 Tax=Bacteria TaxID=2 RepID=UPI003F9095E0
MATEDIYPAGISSPGNNTWLVNDTKAASLADLKAMFDVSCYLPAGEVEIGFSQEREDDTRACHASKIESFGATVYDRKEWVHLVAPQGDGTEQGNLAKSKIKANQTQYVYLRMGVKHGTELKASDRWDEYMVQNGAEHTSPLQSGKYVRKVQTSWTLLRSGVTFA